MFINDISDILRNSHCDPVSISNHPVNMLAYADDILLLSKSQEGLQKSLDTLYDYCNKWQLVVNENKTKIMVFNKVKVNNTLVFNYGNNPLENVQTYNY